MIERRKEKRVYGIAVRRITGRIRPGYTVAVINLSPSGALVEGQRPFPPGRRVDVHLAEDGLRVLIRALVTHCFVALVDAESITYRAGLLFEERVESRERQTPVVYSVPELDRPVVPTPGQPLPWSMHQAAESPQETGGRP
jgi:PilZ domain